MSNEILGLSPYDDEKYKEEQLKALLLNKNIKTSKIILIIKTSLGDVKKGIIVKEELIHDSVNFTPLTELKIIAKKDFLFKGLAIDINLPSLGNFIKELNDTKVAVSKGETIYIEFNNKGILNINL